MVQLYVSEVEILKRQAQRWEALVEWLVDPENSYSDTKTKVTVMSVSQDLVMLHGAKGHIHGKSLEEVADKLITPGGKAGYG
jgi:hypothetical protein